MIPENAKLQVQYAVDTQGLPSVQHIRRWVRAVLKHQKRNAELCVRIVDEKESANLNGKYRRIHRPTNVLSFPAELPECIQSSFIGDLVICAAQAAKQAEQQQKTLNDHWAHLVIHGVLHLLGYDHQSTIDADVMESIEIQVLADLGIANPYVQSQSTLCVQN